MSGSDYLDDGEASHSVDQARRDAAGIAPDVTEASLDQLADAVT